MRALANALLLVAALAACGSKTTPAIRSIACEPPPTNCLTPVECAYDARLRCEVCRCSSPPYTPLGREPD